MVSVSTGWEKIDNTETRVKGNAETTYRIGLVNITPSNIVAADTRTQSGATSSYWAGNHSWQPFNAATVRQSIFPNEVASMDYFGGFNAGWATGQCISLVNLRSSLNIPVVNNVTITFQRNSVG